MFTLDRYTFVCGCFYRFLFISQRFFKEYAGVAVFVFGYLFGRACCDDSAAFVAAFGSEIDDIIGAFYHVEIMFDYYYRVAARSQSLQDGDKFIHIRHMKPGGRFVENIQSSARRTLAEFGCQFYALRFSSRKSCCRLTEFYIA